MSGDWLSHDEWARVQGLVPIVCVDMLAIRHSTASRDVGLILRSTPHQGSRWCLIGGRVLLGETLVAAARRHWTNALGDSLPFELVSAPHVVEYVKDDQPGRPHDPRKHAVAVTYPVLTDGAGVVQGLEAREFRWFDPVDVDAEVMGFGQESVVARLLAAGSVGEGQRLEG